MTRQLFERTQRELQDEILIMGSMVEKAVSRSVEALRSRDAVLAECVVHDDVLINRKRYEIEERCVQLMGLQQPVAADLRTIVAILFIATELERIADHAEGIGRINLLLGEDVVARNLGDIPEMGERACDMLRRALSAFIERDASSAREICNEDDQVDALYDTVYHSLIEQLIRTPDDARRTTYLIWASHNLERIADRVTNICERVIFMVTGELEEINVSRY